MTTIRNLTLSALVLLLAAGLPGCRKQSQTAKSNIEGHWTGFDLARPAEKLQLTITGDQLEYHGAQADDWCRGTFVLNETTQPAQMDLVIKEPPQAVATLLVIYELQGDEIKVARADPGKPRPADFTPSKQVKVLSFKRD